MAQEGELEEQKVVKRTDLALCWIGLAEVGQANPITLFGEPSIET